MKTIPLVAAILVLLAAPAAAQVTKEDVRKLTAAGISDDVILTFMRAHGPVVPMSADDLADLKVAGASDRVLAVLAEASPSAAPSVQNPPPAAPTESVLPPTSYVDYTQSPYASLYSYYSTPPLGDCAPYDAYYYNPWFGYYYPGCTSFACYGAPGFCAAFSFGFPAYGCCFYPWWGGCFSTFGWGCRSFAFCGRPFGFFGRPFGSFFVTNHRFGSFIGASRGGFVAQARSPSLFSASGPVVQAHQASFVRSPAFTQAQVSTSGRSWVAPNTASAPHVSAERTAPVTPHWTNSERTAPVAPRVESRTWTNVQPRTSTGWNTRSYYSTPRSYSTPQSRGFSSGGWGHSGGSSSGGGWGGGGHGGGGHGGGHH